MLSSSGKHSSFGFSLFGVTTARKYFSLLPVDFVSFLSSNPFDVFSCQIHPPSPWPSSFPSTWHRHLHHRFSHVAFFSPFHVAIQLLTRLTRRRASSIFFGCPVVLNVMFSNKINVRKNQTTKNQKHGNFAIKLRFSLLHIDPLLYGRIYLLLSWKCSFC